MDGKASLAKQTEKRFARGGAKSKCCKQDLRTCDGAKHTQGISEAVALENQQCRKDLRKHSRAKKRKRSESAEPESKRYRLDHGRMSERKRESQASQRRNTARRVESIQDNYEGHLLCQEGDLLHGRYEFVATLGKGGYGTVVECIDHGARDGTHVAVKIARNTKWCYKVAHAEVKVLADLKALDPSNAYHCVRMLESFEYRGHVCIVFELLGLSTRDFMGDNNFQPFSLDHVRQMAYQICTSVNFLHMNRLTHTDLKPENIVFVRKDYEDKYNAILKHRLRNPDIKIVDFGLATYDDEYHSSLVTTRPYRAPEVVLELGWSQPCDVWSIGCTLLEYYFGTILFPAHDNQEHLAMMEQVLGPLPEHMINSVSLETRKYFHEGRLVWNKRSAAGRYVSRCCRPLRQFMTCRNFDHKNLFDLIGKMLEYDPAKRITLEEALKHPFFFPLDQGKKDTASYS